MTLPKTSRTSFQARRRALSERFAGAALFASGLPRARNFPANLYPFRASSHFLYFVGLQVENAALLLSPDGATLFVDPPDPDDALWHGPRKALDELAVEHGLDVRPITALDAALAPLRAAVATLPPADERTAGFLSARLGRTIEAGSGASLSPGSPDEALADAMIQVRLRHDAAAVAQLRAAGAESAAAHVEGMRASRAATNEADIAAVMCAGLRRRGLAEAYGPIVTVRGEVLHNHHQLHRAELGDLLLADVGGETPEGWAADITRVWPIGGRFSATQAAVYDVVLAAQRAAIDRVRPGTRYRDVHDAAKRVIVEGLRDLGVLRGDVDGLLERGAAAVFFPHGVGHLIGLDVHDLEDLGDRAGYAPGRTRSPRFGDRFLRLDRDLEPGMAVTIEPGFYQVPGILDEPSYTQALGADFDRAALARFSDVRGIRIEDDVLCTEGAPEVLTAGVPKDRADIERLMSN
jgi:Xaa-Pro aminopeptidase